MARRAALTVLSAALASLFALIGAAGAGAAARGDDIAPGRYIVVYRGVDSVERKTKELERKVGFQSKLRYRHAVKGFAAELSPGQVRKLEADPAVASVTPDRFVHAVATDPLFAGELVPTGIGRIRAGSKAEGTANRASSVSVAVIDTGVDLGHPDLNAVDGTNCVTPGAVADDDNGHGTHVAGTIAGKNSSTDPVSQSVVGVAPGTKVYAVKVLNSAGNGLWSQVICGVDWVTANKDAIKVANMSLGGGGSSGDNNPCGSTTVLHESICKSTGVGVAYAVAAGNSGWNFDYSPAPDVPAVYPEVLTTAAASDSDGQPGGTGPAPTCRAGESDDRYASFSNYATTSTGKQHTLAAPGVCIESTWPGGGYRTISGTSMASPHIAGSVALCDGEAGAPSPGPCAGVTKPADLIPKITHSDRGYGFYGDPNQPVGTRHYGYLALAGSPPPPAPDFSLTADPASRSIARGGSATYAVTVTPSNGFAGNVTLSASGLPNRSSASFNPNPTSSSSTLTVTTSNRTTKGTYTLTITGASGTLKRTTTAKLTVG